jgi:hypothetical protein
MEWIEKPTWLRNLRPESPWLRPIFEASKIVSNFAEINGPNVTYLYDDAARMTHFCRLHESEAFYGAVKDADWHDESQNISGDYFLYNNLFFMRNIF